MTFPDFFAEVPALKLHDGLAQLLGASDDGVIEYHYADAVRLAGHSCPTVAGGWLSARAALHHLYGDELPERGRISVYLNDAENAGVTGVIGQVLTLVTGAAAANGFHGLGGRHVRSNLLHYAQGDVAGVRFRRNDTGAVLEFETEIDGIRINGVDIITWNADSRITHFKVMVRPLKAINKLHELMAAQLQKG